MSMRKVPREVFLAELTWVCEQAKFHGFWVQCNWPDSAQIDVTVPSEYQMSAKCVGKRHEFIFTLKKAGAK